jgi:3-hydroxyacyl-[acyl-carrier-protein] dehydratase
MADAFDPEEFRAPFDITVVMKLLPHRFPFLMIDRVLELEPGKSIKAIKAVTVNEPWVIGHFPGLPIMPGVLMIEAIAQAGGMVVLALPEYYGKLAVLGSAESIRVRQMVTPGDVMTIEAEVLYMKMGASKVRGSISVEGKVAMTGEVVFKTVEQ